MSASFSLHVYERHVSAGVALSAVGIGAPTVTRVAHSQRQVEARLKGELRRLIGASQLPELARFDVRRGIRVIKLRLELTFRGERRRKVTGPFPLIVEPREVSAGHTLQVIYHPLRPEFWFTSSSSSESELAQAASLYFSTAWAQLSEDEVIALRYEGRDRLRLIGFTAKPKSLLDELARARGAFDDLDLDRDKPKAERVLARLGTDLSEAIAHQEGGWLGVPRSPYREDLLALSSRTPRRSVMLVGPSKVGKTTLVRQLAFDLLEQGGYTVHRNLDRVTRVVQITGRRLIAGMSHVGEWEAQVTQLIDEVKKSGVVLYIPDLCSFGRVGQARDSTRSMADVLREPIARGEIAVIGECTERELQRLEDDAPSFASTLQRLHVASTSPVETMSMLIARARALEEEHETRISPWVFRTILDLSAMVHSAQALPGRALDLLERAARGARSSNVDDSTIVGQLVKDTGMGWQMLDDDDALEANDVTSELAENVIGQPAAIAEMTALVLRIRGNMCDPNRPRGVFLFTGPTGTGKTELAKTLAGYMYSADSVSGESARLVRFDMSELSGPDAVARLIGDAWEPEGQLTSAGLAQPFSVFLFDEIEKAHRSVHALLLQLFDDGRLTDARGQTADFRQAVFIMTSNLGANPKPPVGLMPSADDVSLEVQRAVREFFAPELVNRIDAIVPFAPLTLETSVRVAHKELARLFARPGLTERQLFVQMDPETVRAIAEHAFLSRDGARSLKRYLEDHVATLLADAVSSNPGSMQLLRLRQRDGALEVRTRPIVPAQAVASRFALEPLWKGAGAESIQRALGAGRARLEALQRDPRVANLGETLRELLRAPAAERDAAVHHVDGLRAHLARLAEGFDQVERLRESAAVEVIEGSFDPALRPREVLHRGREVYDLMYWLAELHVLDRALDSDPSALRSGQSTTLALYPMTLDGTAGRVSMSWFAQRLAVAYAAARGTVEEIAWIYDSAGVRHVREARGGAALQGIGAPMFVALRISGFGVRDYYAAEAGAHVWHQHTRPELLRVECTDRTPKELAEALRDAHDEDTESLPPMVRQIRFREPSGKRPPNPIEIEDHSVGVFEARRARVLADALIPLWNLRASAEDPR